MGTALLVEYYAELPSSKREDAPVSRRRMQAALDKFKKQVGARYTEGTLQRLLDSSDGTTRRETHTARGSGIGLYAAKRLGESMGARLWVEPAEPTGARFVLALPAAAAV